MLTRITAMIAMFLAGVSLAQEDVPLEEHIIGVWRMELRTLESPGVMYYQEAGTVTIIEQMPDGTFRVMSRVTTRAVAESADLMIRPGCIGKKECVYDEATEGVGVLMDDRIYIDWLDDDGWIDDLLTIEGNVMTGDDGNGPIRLVKEASE